MKIYSVFKEGMTREEKLIAANEYKRQIMSFFLRDKLPEVEMEQEFPKVEMTDFKLDPKNNGSFLAKLELVNNDKGDKDSIQYYDLFLNENDEMITSIENIYLSPEEIELKERESYGEQVDAVENEYNGSYEMSEILEVYQKLQSKKADLFQEKAGQPALMSSIVIDADSNQKYLYVKDTQTEREDFYPINEADLSVKVNRDPRQPEYSLNLFLSKEKLQEVTDSINMLESVRVELSESEIQNLPEEVVLNLIENYQLENERGETEMEIRSSWDYLKEIIIESSKENDLPNGNLTNESKALLENKLLALKDQKLTLETMIQTELDAPFDIEINQFRTQDQYIIAESDADFSLFINAETENVYLIQDNVNENEEPRYTAEMTLSEALTFERKIQSPLDYMIVRVKSNAEIDSEVDRNILDAIQNSKAQIQQALYERLGYDPEDYSDSHYQPSSKISDFSIREGYVTAEYEIELNDLGHDSSSNHYEIFIDPKTNDLTLVQADYVSWEPTVYSTRLQTDMNDLLNEKENATEREASVDEMQNAYANALVLQESYGFNSDVVEWENPKLLDILRNEEPKLLEYFKSLQKLDQQYEELTNEVGNWGNDVQPTEKQLEKSKASFSRFINQLELNQNGPITQQDSDLLKASYTPTEEYHVVFGLDFDDETYGLITGLADANNQVYDATYRNGEIVALYPENESLMEHLKTNKEFPNNVITDSDRSYLLGISNDFTKGIEEYQSIIDETKRERRNPARDFELDFNNAIQKETPVERLTGLRELKQNINQSMEKFSRMDEILLDTQPKLKEIMENQTYRTEIQSDMERLYQKFSNPDLFKSGAFQDLRNLREMATHISSLEMQNIRYERLEGEFFKTPHEAAMVSRFDPSKPFSFAFSSQESKFEGPSKFIETLNRQVINEPKEIANHYLQIIDRINHYDRVSHFSRVNKVNLSEYAEQAMQEAVKTIEKSFENDYPASPSLDIKIETRIFLSDRYEGMDKLREIHEKTYPLKAVASLDSKKPLTVLNLASAKIEDPESKKFWKDKAQEMIENHAGRAIGKKMEKGVVLTDFKNVKQALTQLKESHFRSNSNGKPRIENEMLDYIGKLENTQQKMAKEIEQKQEKAVVRKPVLEMGM